MTMTESMPGAWLMSLWSMMRPQRGILTASAWAAQRCQHHTAPLMPATSPLSRTRGSVAPAQRLPQWLLWKLALQKNWVKFSRRSEETVTIHEMLRRSITDRRLLRAAFCWLWVQQVTCCQARDPLLTPLNFCKVRFPCFFLFRSNIVYGCDGAALNGYVKWFNQKSPSLANEKEYPYTAKRDTCQQYDPYFQG